MKIFILLIICALANHFLGWSLLVLSLVAVLSYVCQKMLDILVKRTALKLGNSVIDGAVGELREDLEGILKELVE